MAHESHYSGQFLLGVNPLMQGLEVEGNSDLLGIEMLEGPSKHQLSADHFSKSFAGYQDLLDSSNTAASAWPPLDSSSSSSPMPLLQGSKQMNMKLSLSLLNTKPPSALPEFMHQEQPKPAYHHHQQQQQQLFDLKNSMYLKAARELLIECCSLEGGSSSKERHKRTSHWELEREPTASILQPSLYSMNHLELHSLKIKLFSMLEEVEKRYRKYCEQMQAIVSMLESAAGEGAADVYSTLASKAMSRHFRRLKDGILGQLKAAKKAMGEKDDDRATGTTRGETPRLRLLDQCVRQHKALQQGMAHQQLPWRPLRGLPEHSVSILRAWLFEHFLHPYPSDVDKIILARQTGLSRSQVSNWFINARVRIWKPMVEEMYLEEMKELDNNHLNHHQHINAGLNPNPRPSAHSTDQKPSLPVQLLNLDSESLSSIVNGRHHGDESFHRGVVDFDFSTAYSNFFAGDSLRKSSVSLTLGLQQHSGGGMSLSFSPASQHSIVFSKEHIDSGQQVDFSVLDGRHRRFPAMT